MRRAADVRQVPTPRVEDTPRVEAIREFRCPDGRGRRHARNGTFDGVPVAGFKAIVEPEKHAAWGSNSVFASVKIKGLLAGPSQLNNARGPIVFRV